MKTLIMAVLAVVAFLLALPPVSSEAQGIDPCGSCTDWCQIRYGPGRSADDPYLFCSCMKGCAEHYCAGQEVDLPPGCSRE
jgi:hypothetical protein